MATNAALLQHALRSPSPQRRIGAASPRGLSVGGSDSAGHAAAGSDGSLARELSRQRQETEYLQMSLTYAQTVATVFRQRIALMMKDALALRGAHGEEGLNAALTALAAEGEGVASPRGGGTGRASPGGSVTATPRGVASPRGDATPPPHPDAIRAATERAEHWRQQFLSLVGESRPAGLQDAQALCRLLQEKNALAMREAELRRESEAQDARYRALKLQFEQLLRDKGMTAEHALREAYRLRVDELEADAGACAALREENARLQADHQRAEQRSVALRLRNAKLLALQRAAGQPHLEAALLEAGTKLTDTTAELRTTAAGAAAKSAEVRRLATDLVHMQRTVALRDNTIARLEAKVEALGREAQVALLQSFSESDAKELVFLRRQVDTFELHVRSLERDAQAARDAHAALEATIAGRDREAAALRATNEALTREKEALAEQLRALELGDTQHAVHAEMVADLSGRVIGAVDAITAMHGGRDFAARLAEIGTRCDVAQSLRRSLEMRERDLAAAHGQLAVYRAELGRCAVRGVAPDVDRVARELVRHDVKGTPPERLAGEIVRDVVLRRDGTWREVRDGASGKVYYLTDTAKGTPFAPFVPPPAPVVVVASAPVSRLLAAPVATSGGGRAVVPRPDSPGPASLGGSRGSGGGGSVGSRGGSRPSTPPAPLAATVSEPIRVGAASPDELDFLSSPGSPGSYRSDDML